MTRITAVVHTHNDGLRLGRCLETLYPCDGILIVDHGSHDSTLRLAHEYGGEVVSVKSGLNLADADYLSQKDRDWILCLAARESLTESLAASLYQWKLEQRQTPQSFSVRLREETANGWVEHGKPQTRLVPTNWRQWNGSFPVNDPRAQDLDGAILRFSFP